MEPVDAGFVTGDPPAFADTTFNRGFIALTALNRAGTQATCQFENAWLWLIE